MSIMRVLSPVVIIAVVYHSRYIVMVTMMYGEISLYEHVIYSNTLG